MGSMAINTYHFQLHLSRNQIAQYYQGTARDISVHADNGVLLRFAARHLRRFLTPKGVHGRFRLTTDHNNRFQALTKLS